MGLEWRVVQIKDSRCAGLWQPRTRMRRLEQGQEKSGPKEERTGIDGDEGMVLEARREKTGRKTSMGASGITVKLTGTRGCWIPLVCFLPLPPPPPPPLQLTGGCKGGRERERAERVDSCDRDRWEGGRGPDGR